MSEDLKRPEQLAPSQQPVASLPGPGEQDQFTPHLAREFFLSVLDYGQEEHKAKGQHLPGADGPAAARGPRHRSAHPHQVLRRDKPSPEELEQQFGVTVRERSVSWLGEPAVRPGRHLAPPGATTNQLAQREWRRVAPRGALPAHRRAARHRGDRGHLEAAGRAAPSGAIPSWAARELEAMPRRCAATTSSPSSRSCSRRSSTGTRCWESGKQAVPDIVERSGRFFTIIAQVAVGHEGERGMQLRKCRRHARVRHAPAHSASEFFHS